jgi:hypothetical protein
MYKQNQNWRRQHGYSCSYQQQQQQQQQWLATIPVVP